MGANMWKVRLHVKLNHLHITVAFWLYLPFWNDLKEYSYTPFCFSVTDLQVMVLKEEHSCPGAMKIVQW